MHFAKTFREELLQRHLSILNVLPNLKFYYFDLKQFYSEFSTIMVSVTMRISCTP